MDLAPDFDEFIASLIGHSVEFVIVGAYALAFQGRILGGGLARPERRPVWPA